LQPCLRTPNQIFNSKISRAKKFGATISGAVISARGVYSFVSSSDCPAVTDRVIRLEKRTFNQFCKVFSGHMAFDLCSVTELIKGPFLQG
jgi:hypothetical protein